ncbi:hypothetical protein N0V82_000598 [Gnomoniopsis sp. IMI 355080]|nr:hypothetical protein N0V82_000598 [Gnomoniopsis sp. IMI 355080]
MEGLKLIAQSTFDKQQKFRPSAGAGTTTTTTTADAAYRYNVIEIGAFGGASSSSISNAAKRQSVGSVQSASGGGRQNGSSKISLNEWMVFEDDLCSFMRKRPIDYLPTAASSASFGGELEKSKTAAQSSNTTTNTSSAPSAPSRSASMHSSKITATNNSTTAATAATTVTSASAAGNNSNNDRLRSKDRGGKEEVEAVASLKLVCIPRAGVDDAGNPDTDSNTLAIGRETFLRLYVDHMDADHCALYYVAREYDGYHEFNDTPKGVVTKFLGTSEYALIWTFNRRTLETRGLFLDRCQRWRSSDSSAAAAASQQQHANHHDGSAPVTPVKKFFGDMTSSPSTPSKRWTKKQTGTVSASEAWSAFRDTLNVYRKYIFAPQVLSFVCCVQMLRFFDDQANEEDLPRLKEVESGLRDVGNSSDVAAVDGISGVAEPPSSIHPSSTQTSSFALVTDRNPFGPSTPPGDDEKLIIPTSTQQPGGAGVGAGTAGLPTREKLVSQSIVVSRVDTSLANKLRHLKMARNILEVIARDNETLTVDVVASTFLDRYHWAMEGMNEAIPALERHISSLEEYLRYLKGRSERLSGLVRSLLTIIISLPATTTTTTSRTQSDALSLRCNEADSRSSDRSLGRPVAPHDSGGRRTSTGPAISALDRDRSRGSEAGQEDQRRQRRIPTLGFYAGYLFRGNYSHRLA